MKIFIISDTDADTLKNKSEMKNVEIVARVENKKLITDSLCYPPNAIRFAFNPLNNRVSIEFQLTNGQSLAIGDKE